MIVRLLHRGPLRIFRRSALPSLVVLLSVASSACGLFASRSGLSNGYYLPLTVQLRLAPSVSAAQITYRDACGETKTLPLAGPLAAALKRKTGLVFEKVVTESSDGTPVDGYQDVEVGLVDLDLAVTRKINRTYPATVAIGLDFAYSDPNGTVLYGKKLKSIGRGDVQVAESSCDVGGLDRIAQDAIDAVTDGMAKQLGTATKIRDAAEARRAGSAAPTATASAPPSPIAAPGGSEEPNSAATAAPAKPAPPAVSGDPAALMFRVIIRDENRNQILHTGETISVEVEVKNEGPGEAVGVEVLVQGTPELVEQIPTVLPVGNIAAGEVKRVSLDGKIGTVKEAMQAELLLGLRSRSPSDQLPSAKKFLVAMMPHTAPEAQAIPVDVDEIPKRMGKLKQPKAIGIAIGIGQFRETAFQRVKYAAHDAETVANYWQAVLGIPAERVRRLLDAHALKGDLAELFEEWLPKQIDPATVVYLYISGRGIVDRATGAVSLMPFDGTATGSPRVYSLRRLQEALVRLPIQRAIVILDLSLEPLPKTEASNRTDSAPPLWEQESEAKDKIMWMVGNRTVQEAHAYDPGQHGLFTYELLKGLAGAADFDKDGTVLTGELCAYAKGQVVTMAREQFGNEQEPICIPGPGHGAMVRLQPIAKLK
ncbi:MAG TPA: caspase family protein [Nitrospira sp.]|nr:caspase family protein [Nitrospira sp.]